MCTWQLATVEPTGIGTPLGWSGWGHPLKVLQLMVEAVVQLAMHKERFYSIAESIISKYSKYKAQRCQWKQELVWITFWFFHEKQCQSSKYSAALMLYLSITVPLTLDHQHSGLTTEPWSLSYAWLGLTVLPLPHGTWCFQLQWREENAQWALWLHPSVCSKASAGAVSDS